jgi:hypothetical protein
MSNAVVEYLKKAFDGRNLEADAEKLLMPVEKLKSLIEDGAIISAKFAKELEEKINSIRASELLDAQLTQAKAEAKAAGKADSVAAEARAAKPAETTEVPQRQGRAGQGCDRPLKHAQRGNLLV